MNLHVPPNLILPTLDCEVHRGGYPYLHPSEAEYTEACNANALRHISCKTPDVKRYLDDVGGLDLMAIKAIHLVSATAIPRFIPVLDRRLTAGGNGYLPVGTVGLSFKDAFAGSVRSNRGCYRVNNLRIADRLLTHPPFHDQRTILFCTGPDVYLESFWVDYQANRYLDRLRSQQFAMITAPDFSLFLGGCALGQAYNLKRSLTLFAELQQAGVPTMPHLYWLNNHQLERWAQWLQANPLVQIVTINCQLYRKHESYLVRQGIQYLNHTVGPRLHFLLEGPNQACLRELRMLSEYIHVAVKWPAIYALNNRRLIYNSERIQASKQITPISRVALAANNIAAYAQYLDEQFFAQLDIPLRVMPLRSLLPAPASTTVPMRR